MHITRATALRRITQILLPDFVISRGLERTFHTRNYEPNVILTNTFRRASPTSFSNPNLHNHSARVPISVWACHSAPSSTIYISENANTRRAYSSPKALHSRFPQYVWHSNDGDFLASTAYLNVAPVEPYTRRAEHDPGNVDYSIQCTICWLESGHRFHQRQLFRHRHSSLDTHNGGFRELYTGAA